MHIHMADWSSMEWQAVRAGVERKVFSAAGSTIALNRLWPGHLPLPHSHIHEQIVYIIEGQVDFHIGSELIRLGPGGLAVVPANVTHYAEVVGDKPVINLDVFTPARPEYVS